MRKFSGAIFAAALVCAGAAQAQVLTITDGKQSVELSRDKLAQMKQDSIETIAPKMTEKATFTGPSFTDVLNEAGLSGETIHAAGLDSYAKDIPREKLTGDGAIVALSMNGKPLPAERAPFWIIFPYDKAPGMNDHDHQSWSVYQLTTLTVK